MKNTIVLSILFGTILACNAADTKQNPISEYLSKTSISTYGTAGWEKLGGSAKGGVGFSLEFDTFKNVGLRLSMEADSWKPSDYFVDRTWADLKYNVKLSDRVTGYGFGGFGASVPHADIGGHAGLGFQTKIIDRLSIFVEGSLEAFTNNKHNSRLSGGFNLKF